MFMKKTQFEQNELKRIEITGIHQNFDQKVIDCHFGSVRGSNRNSQLCIKTNCQ